MDHRQMDGVKKSTTQRLKRQRNVKANVPLKLELEVEENEPKDEVPKNSGENQPPVKKLNWEPPHWTSVLDNIRKMCISGSSSLGTTGEEIPTQEAVEPSVRRFQMLVSLMLSSQTKDQVTFAATERLKQRGLTIDSILTIEESELGILIKPVSFWRKKAIYIKKTSQILREKYEDDIPKTVKDLCSLPGVGPKMAYIAMNDAWNENAGIGVDTHVHRISNRLKWVGEEETSTPEKTRKALESWLPPELWQEISVILVGFGQKICLPVGPKCSGCLNNKICPYGKSNSKTQRPQSSNKRVTNSDEESE